MLFSGSVEIYFKKKILFLYMLYAKGRVFFVLNFLLIFEKTGIQSFLFTYTGVRIRNRIKKYFMKSGNYKLILTYKDRRM